jgi:methyl-accepting chemotaxis protein
MSRNVTEAAKGSGEILQNIEGVATAADGTTRGAQDAQKSAQQLSLMSSELRGLVGRFKLGDRENSGAEGRNSRAQAAHAAAR